MGPLLPQLRNPPGRLGWTRIYGIPVEGHQAAPIRPYVRVPLLLCRRTRAAHWAWRS